MRQKLSMKLRSILFLILCFNISSFLAQKNGLIYSSNELLSTKEKSILLNNRVNKLVEKINVNLLVLKKNNKIELQFADKHYEVNTAKITVRGINNFSWVGENLLKDGNIMITVLNGNIQGLITKGLEVYRIITTVSGEYVVIKIDQSKYPEEKCLKEPDNVLIQSQKREVEVEKKGINNKLNNTCKVRLAVLYTPAAESNVVNIKNHIQLAVDETNQSFINSDVNFRVELAYLEKTNYVEVDYLTDLNKFITNGDGVMDEIHSLRDKYAADICILINEDIDVCGVAKTTLATDQKAFCIVDYDCATGYYSFAHEVGHLMGCEHDYYVENSVGDAHGYVNLSQGWRTIMAYNKECSDNGKNCVRLQYWSTPNVNYGLEVMGTHTTENCVLMLNNQASNVMSFRQPINNLLLTNIDILNGVYADVNAQYNVETNGNVIVNNGMELNVFATKEIVLKPGFEALLGSEFNVATKSIAACGVMSSSKLKYNEDEDLLKNKEDENYSLTIYPNPTNNDININYKLKTNEQISIKIVGFLGRTILSLKTNEFLKPGSYSNKVSLSGLSAGVYFVQILTTKKTINKKIVVQN